MRTKSLFLVFAMLILGVGTSNAQVANVVWNYNFPVEDTVLNQLGSIRALIYDDDLLGDGVSAIAVTNYVDNGRVHIFRTVGDNALEMVWTSPAPDSLGGDSSPRHIAFGDMDGDGRKEVIYHSRYNGIFLYEWDGVPGSYNFGTKPSQQITVPVISHGKTGKEFCEFIEVMDYDNDGKQELAIAYNSAPNANDNYYVISAIGHWSTDSPGFSGFTTEFILKREDPYDYGLNGSPYAMFGADLDGDGDKDIIITNYNFKNVVPITTVEFDSFAKPDTVSDKAHFYLTSPPDDDVALFGGMAADIDGDNREEVYLPTYGANYNLVHMIHYEPGQSTYEIDSTNVFAIDLAPHISSDKNPASLGFGIGDIDGDSKPNLYFTSIVGLGETVISAEFQGGDKTDAGNWIVETIYEGDPTVVSELVVEIDTAGNVIDTIKITKNSPFVSKMYANYTDFDKDGFEDLLLPFQVVNDSIAWGAKRWISGTEFVQEIKNILNPKRHSIRILENSLSGIKVKDLTIITPDDYELKQNYPNPFNPETNIEFFLPIRKKISLTVYNALGQKVKSLISDQRYDAGPYKISWDGSNETGNRVASGVYIYTLKYGNFTKSKRMTLLK